MSRRILLFWSPKHTLRFGSSLESFVIGCCFIAEDDAVFLVQNCSDVCDRRKVFPLNQSSSTFGLRGLPTRPIRAGSARLGCVMSSTTWNVPPHFNRYQQITTTFSLLDAQAFAYIPKAKRITWKTLDNSSSHPGLFWGSSMLGEKRLSFDTRVLAPTI